MRAFVVFLLLCPAGLFAQRGGRGGPVAIPPGPPKNLKILPQDVNLQQTMNGIRTALGVQCNFCHTVTDFPSDDNPNKLIARNMMRMVTDLNASPALNGKTHVTCYTCHRGQSTPLMEPAPEGGRGGRGGRGGAGGRGRGAAPQPDEN